MRINTYVRLGYTEQQLLDLKDKVVNELEEGKQVQSISMPGLSATYTNLTNLQQKLDAVCYALWKINPIAYAECRPDPRSYRILSS